jgi:hypothetical protein
VWAASEIPRIYFFEYSPRFSLKVFEATTTVRGGLKLKIYLGKNILGLRNIFQIW